MKIMKKKSFTLIELLIVIAVIVVFVMIAVLILTTLQPTQRARDSKRLTDINTLSQAIGQVDSNGIFMGTSSVVYVSIPSNQPDCSDLSLPVLPTGWSYACVNLVNYTKTDGTGWIPVDFSHTVSGQKVLNVLPVDPVNTSSTGLYYTYTRNNGSWEVTTLFESATYQQQYAARQNSSSDTVYGAGNDLTLTPSVLLSRGGGESIVLGSPFDIFVGPGGQIAPFVSYDSYNSRFLVTWDEMPAGNPTDENVYGQLVKPDGTLFGSRIPVAVVSGSIQAASKSAFDTVNKRFLVTFFDLRNRAKGEVYGQFINSDGTLYGSNFLITPPSNPLENVGSVGVVFDPILNRYLVVIVQTISPTKTDLYGQFVAPDGTLIGTYFNITDVADGTRVLGSSVGYDSNNGRFFLVYGRASINKIDGRLLNGDGSLYGSEFVVSDVLGGVDSYPVPFDASNNRFLVLWDGSSEGASGRLVNSSGTLFGNELTINLGQQGFDIGTGEAIFDTAKNRYLFMAYSSSSELSGQLLNTDGSLDGQVFLITNSFSASAAAMRPVFAFGSSQSGSLIVWPDMIGVPAFDLYGKFLLIK